MYAVRPKPYGWDLKKKAKISSKNTKKAIFGLFIFSQKLCRRLKRFYTVIFTSYYRTMCAIRSKPYGWDLKKKATISSKNTKKNIFGLFIFLKNCAGDSNDFLKSFYIILGHHACNQTKTV